jgi:Photosynthesis system II assembly factor YCF48/Putative zinc-finger
MCGKKCRCVRSLKGWIGNVRTSGPNPLRQALAHSQQAGPHLDPEMLTAFAENTLVARERKEVLEHLAICAECREILTISTAASPEFPAEVQASGLPRPTHPPLRSWLPWVSVAAGIVIVCSAVLIHQQRKPNLTTPAQVASISKKEQAQAPPQTEQKKISPEPKVRHAKPARGPVENSARTAPRGAENSSAASSDQKSVGSSTDQIHADRPTSSRIATAKAVAGQAQTVEVQGAKSSLSTSAFAGQASSPVMNGALGTHDLRPHWRINESGQVERSFGYGEWQAVLPNEKWKMRVVSVFDSDVWVGGEELHLYHSTDNGATWNAVTLPNKAAGEHAVAHIRFQTQQAGTVEAEDGTSWTTTDGGRTWE